MGSRPFPEISCAICSLPMDLRIDLCADENGKAIHEDCYCKRLFSESPKQNRETLLEVLASPALALRHPEITAASVAAEQPGPSVPA